MLLAGCLYPFLQVTFMGVDGAGYGVAFETKQVLFCAQNKNP